LGTPPGSIVTVPSDSSTITVPEPPAPAATVVKTSDTTKVSQAGQVIHYSFTVTNTGNTSLSDPKVNEGAFTGHGKVTVPVCPTTPAALLPGESIVCTASYTVVAADLTGQALSNTATVSATPPGGDPITSAPSTARITDVAGPAPVPDSPLASTGSTIGWGIGATALVLLVAGGALLLIRRRRAAE
jgi:LPXTG-motif cell wall-anchored protein